MILYVGGSTNSTAITGPGTYTARYTGNNQLQPWEKLQTTAAATGILTGTQASAVTSAGITIALRPAKMTATTAAMTGTARLHHDWTIIVTPMLTSVGALGLQVSDRAVTTNGTSGVVTAAMPATPARSHVDLSVALAPVAVSTTPQPAAARRYGTATTDTEVQNATEAAFLRSKFDILTPRFSGKDAQMFGDGGAALKRILAFGLPVRLHTAIWWSGRDTRATTKAITTQAAMKTAIEARITEMVTIAKPYNLPDMCMDVINEPFTDTGGIVTNYLGVSSPFSTSYGATQTGLFNAYRDAAAKARALWPELKLGVNDYGLVEWPDPTTLTRPTAKDNAMFALASRFGPQSATVLDRGMLDFIGVQFHPDNDGGQPTIAEMVTFFNRYAAIGVDVHITEMGIPGDTSVRWSNVFAAAAQCPNVKVAVIWGPTDAQSDVSGGTGSMPYNANYTSKSYATYPEAWHNQTPVSATAKIVIARSSDGAGVNVVSVPVGTSLVKVAVSTSLTAAAVQQPSVPVATATAPGYKYTPPAGFPYVDMAAVDASGVDIPPPPADPYAGRVVTNVVNTPTTSADNTTIPPSSVIIDSVGANWTLVADPTNGNVVYRNGGPTISSSVQQLLYKNNIVYQVNTVGDWYKWNDTSISQNQWEATTNPTGTTTTPPVTPPPSGADPQLIGVEISGWGSGIGQMAKNAGIKYCRVNNVAYGIWSQYSGVGLAIGVLAFDDGPIGSVDPTTYATKCYNALVAHPEVKRLEVLNEPFFMSDNGNTAKFMEILIATYNKCAPLGVKIILPYDPNNTWQDRVTAAGALNYCHEVSIHPYGGADGGAGGAAGNRTRVTAAFARAGKKVCITEVGWPTDTSQPPTGDSQQWSYSAQNTNVANFMTWVQQNPNMISACYYFQIHDYGTNQGYGLIDRSNAAKPSLATFGSYATD
jgi:GH35 family endo-1,4-beta-xylanase